MLIEINNKTLELRKTDVSIARKIVTEFFRNAESNCSKMGSFSLYYTVLIMAHVISGELLNTYDPKKVNKIISLLNSKNN